MTHAHDKPYIVTFRTWMGLKVHLGPPCGFWRIDDQQLEIYHCVESFVVYDIQKGNTHNEIKFYMGYNEEKREKSRRFLRIEDFIFYLSLKSSILSRGIHWVSW
jgi:hypothetical protein